MSPSSNPDQDQNLEDAAIQESQVQLGQAGGDSIQIVGSNNQVVVHPYRSQPSSREQPLDRQEYRNRQVLLNKVRNFWVKGVLEKSLYNKSRIELGLEERFDTLELMYETPEQLRQALPSGTKAIDKFDELGEGRTLLILGHPGGGKTTTLLELVRDLIQRSEQDVTLPIPIVVNLSSWTDKNQQIADWLVQELNSKYQVSKKTGRTWLQCQQLLLLLDGLDEVKENLRDACVQAINQFSQERGQTEIVVCCRIKDYEVLSQRLRFQGSIFIQPLTSEQIMDYLDQAGSALAGVKTALQTNFVLQDLAESPLMLSIMALAYQGVSASELAQMIKEEQQKHLFDLYIQKMFDRRIGKQSYPKEQAKCWLILLSQRMMQESQATFLIEKIQPTWLRTKKQRWEYRAGIIAISWLVWSSSSIIPILFILFSRDSIFLQAADLAATDLATNLMNALGGGFLVGTVLCILAEKRDKGIIKSVEALKWSWREAWGGFVAWSRNCLIVGLIFGLIIGVLSGFASFFSDLSSPFNEINSDILDWLSLSYINSSDTLASRLIIATVNSISILLAGGLIGLFFGLLGVFFWGIIGGLFRGSKGAGIGKSVVPNQGIRRSATNAKFMALALGVIGGFIHGTFLYLFMEYLINFLSKNIHVIYVMGWWEKLYCFLVAFLGWAALGWLVFGLACIQHLTLRLILYKEELMPWNYARFLDWACDRLFLQRVGGGYIFVHRLLMEHFAQMETSAEKGSQSD